MAKLRVRFILLVMGCIAFWTMFLYRGIEVQPEGPESFAIFQPLVEEPSSPKSKLSGILVRLRRSPPSEEYEDEIFSTTATAPSLQVPTDKKYDQLDPYLINLVKSHLLPPPPLQSTEERGTPHFFRESTAIKEKLEFIEKYLIEKNTKPGFFIEYGAPEGTFVSPTLPLEREYNWTGVVIEPDRILFEDLMKTRRNAWTINVALCNTTNSQRISVPRRSNGGISELQGLSQKFDVDCVPLYTILAALNVSTVDYFSLDGGDSDFDILKTVPFDKIVFKVLTVENTKGRWTQRYLDQFLVKNGYTFIGTVVDYFTQDSLFVHKSIYTSDMTLKIKVGMDKGYVRRFPGFGSLKV